jgi:hypothetical protein
MDGYLRLRQICLVAPALRPAEEGLAAVLGVGVCFRDPGVGRFGLENALFPLGTGVLEVVAPTRDGTAAGRFLERSGGRGGYMVILDCDSPERRRAHAEALGLRVAHEYRHEGYLGVQLHPRDTRAAMIEFNRTAGGEALEGPYHPAGPDWPRVVREAGDGGPRMVAVEIEGPDPAGLAAHWARILEAPVTAVADGADGGEVPCIDLPGGLILFLRTAGAEGGERLAGLRIALPDPARALAAAEARGLRGADGRPWLAGVRFALTRR